MPSFDIVSKVDPQEVDNAIHQARKEVGQRYDFKGTKTEIELEEGEIRVFSDDDYKVKAVVEIIQSKLARRNVPLKALSYGTIEPASGGRSKQAITVRQGIDTEHGREIIKLIKSAKLKVQAQIQSDQLRVTAKKRDDLQRMIQMLKDEDLDLPLQFTNYRD
jgi:cyclic-di-GMP-binding protein